MEATKILTLAVDQGDPLPSIGFLAGGSENEVNYAVLLDLGES